MPPRHVVEFVHVLLAFFYVGGLLASHLNMLTARRMTTWAEKAALLAANRRATMFVGFPALILLGLAGNVLGMVAGYRMSDTPAFRIVNGLWLACVLVAAVLDLPVTARLAAMSRAAAANGGGEPVDWNARLGTWRVGNSIQLVLFVVLLWFMAAPWRT